MPDKRPTFEQTVLDILIFILVICGLVLFVGKLIH